MCSLKRTFFALISLIFCLGIVITGIAIWILLDDRIGHFSTSDNFNITKQLYNSSYVIITFGAIFIIIGAIGLWGVGLEKPRVLCLFSSLLCIPLVLSVSAMAVAWFSAKDKEIRMVLEDELLVVWKDPNTYGKIESNLQCCGVLGIKEYKGYPPDSCKEEGTQFYYSDGCLDRFCHVAYVTASILTGLSLAIITLAVISAILAMIIRRRIKDSTEAVPVRCDEIIFKALPI